MYYAVFHGTVAEWEAARSAFTQLAADALGEDNVTILATDSPPSTEQPTLTEDAVIEFLTRVPLNPRQRAIISLVRDAGEAGVFASELAEAVGGHSEFKATMRNFGKRRTHTAGWPVGIQLFDQVWMPERRDGRGENKYRLHPAMRAVLASGRVAI